MQSKCTVPTHEACTLSHITEQDQTQQSTQDSTKALSVHACPARMLAGASHLASGSNTAVCRLPVSFSGPRSDHYLYAHWDVILVRLHQGFLVYLSAEWYAPFIFLIKLQPWPHGLQLSPVPPSSKLPQSLGIKSFKLEPIDRIKGP